MKKKTDATTSNIKENEAQLQIDDDLAISNAQENELDIEFSEEEENLSDITLLQAKVDELQDKFLRQAAEFDNYRKRTIKEKANIIKYASADIVTAILPIIDDIERAVENSRDIEDVNVIKEGMELIYNKLMRILESKGLKKISPKDEPFDTDYHEAIATIPAPNKKTVGRVIDCARDGYLLEDKVLRHAQVAVAQ
ncbi:MAG TPA: nucleotide exchange factor GrpE [Bacteroidaceae bacterium]|nr:nucleotide exchange factor GrpE [Bacteroidaceae bacterium]